MSGFIDFSYQIYPPDGRVYLGGRTYDNWLEVAGGMIDVAEGNGGVVFVPTAAGTHIVQRFFRGLGSPAAAGFKTFSSGFLADSEDDFIAFVRTQGHGEPTTFFPGDWDCEAFTATDGGTYRLKRMPALGVVPGLEAEDFPIRIFLDNVEDDDNASIAGRTVTANGTGLLEIVYAPLYTVALQGVTKKPEDTNTLIVTMTLVEGIMP